LDGVEYIHAAGELLALDGFLNQSKTVKALSRDVSAFILGDLSIAEKIMLRPHIFNTWGTIRFS
jgi:hypothetical protein